MPIELPQTHHQTPGPLRPGPGGRAGALGWSEADELAALETVWESLCQEAAAPRPVVPLPDLPSSRLARASSRLEAARTRNAGRSPQRRQDRLTDASDRLASSSFLFFSQSFVVKDCMDRLFPA
jgi:hypothetical protein